MFCSYIRTVIDPIYVNDDIYICMYVLQLHVKDLMLIAISYKAIPTQN